MEDWDAIAESKKIPQAVYDAARTRARKLALRIGGTVLTIIAAFEIFVVAAGIVSLKELLGEFAPLAVGLALFYYLLRRKRWYVAAGSIYVATWIISALVSRTTRSIAVSNIAYAILFLPVLAQMRSVRRYENEIRKRLGGSPSPIKPA